MVDEKNEDGLIEFTDSEQAPPKEAPDMRQLKEIEENMKKFTEVVESFSEMSGDIDSTVKEVSDLLAQIEPLIKLYSK